MTGTRGKPALRRSQQAAKDAGNHDFVAVQVCELIELLSFSQNQTSLDGNRQTNGL
jgi:hypothetical protein